VARGYRSLFNLLQSFHTVFTFRNRAQNKFDTVRDRSESLGIGARPGGQVEEIAQNHPPEQALKMFLHYVIYALILMDADQPGHIGIVNPKLKGGRAR